MHVYKIVSLGRTRHSSELVIKSILHLSKHPNNKTSDHPPPIINTCRISRIFLHSITIDISDSICWNNIEYINSNRSKRSDVQVNKVTDVSRSTASSIFFSTPY